MSAAGRSDGAVPGSRADRSPVFGVIEGFYGPPWSWDARARIVRSMGEQGSDLYVYAPKDDPLHRQRWREAYDGDTMRRFASLARLADASGVELVLGLTPVDVGLDVRAELELVWKKARQFLDIGVTGFSILFDDLPQGLPRDRAARVAAARWQATVANDLRARLLDEGVDGTLQLTPTQYHGRGSSPYLRALGEALDPAIDVFWTGPEVCSETITPSDLERVTASLRRRPLLWDNYPVNDGAMRRDPHIRPLTGRHPALKGAIRGLVANGAIQPDASRIAFHTLARWWRDPSAYEPESAWSEALERMASDARDAEALGVLGRLARRSPLERTDGDELPWLDDARPADCQAASDALAGAVTRLEAGGIDPHLRRDLDPWIVKLRHWSDAVRAAVDLDVAARDGAGRVPAGTIDEVRTALRAARGEPARIADARFAAFVRRALHGASRVPRPRLAR